MPNPTETAPLIDRPTAIRMAIQSLGPSPFDYRPYRYSRSPLRLFFGDLATFSKVLWTITDVVRPLHGKDAGDDGLDTWRGRRDDFLLMSVSMLQFLFLPVALAGVIILPGIIAALWMLILWSATSLMLGVVQGPRLVNSKVDLEQEGARGVNSHSDEKWIFINGVMVGNVGLQSAVDGIARVFKRPVLGIHNETQGFFGDIFECLMQRCFSYSTKDVRAAYREIFLHITKPEVRRVILIAHSQGGIIASLVLDRLFTELPKEIVGKLEIYTFGSAASHFNNPSHLLLDYENFGPQSTQNTSHKQATVGQESTNGATSTSSDDTAYTPPHACSGHVITTIEHYANESDPIPRWGVLHAYDGLLDTHYSGHLFVKMGFSGHLFTSHYLASWFPYDAQAASAAQNQSVVFRESPVSQNVDATMGDWQDSMLDEATRMEWGDGKHASKKDLERLEAARRKLREGQFYALPDHTRRMQKVSRLWQYVDGGSPG